MWTKINILGYGKCGVAVIRVSGSNSGEALKIMTKMKELPKSRYALLKNIYHPKSNEILDKGLVLWFPGIIHVIKCIVSLHRIRHEEINQYKIQIL